LAGLGAASATPAFASSFPVTGARIVAHFDIAALQQPENITLEPDGTRTFARARVMGPIDPSSPCAVTERDASATATCRTGRRDPPHG
jgi:hypothetical protein